MTNNNLAANHETNQINKQKKLVGKDQRWPNWKHHRHTKSTPVIVSVSQYANDLTHYNLHQV